ncbi:helix-turn-helix domain-containing protein [Halorubrum kocurii]|uniref:Bacterio-opsin activator HTH domain-containing protein n=1 Tax=Halorubrum kocurii JCM 14978 TaxID=1230456 RepID=M0PK49_9EURY|nr:helix-turn-helix domain-containing protein [Halorubrum kocurii]EMA69984.1 bacterio-opsin activator HTH domain-containing protein [Halorubrum kocurii JCM 14978]
MSVFGEFRVPPRALALSDTFDAEPETVIQIDRVVASEMESLTQYFIVSGVSNAAFEEAAALDESIDALQQILDAEQGTMYRAIWGDSVEALVQEYTDEGTSILKAMGTADGWVLRIRFDDHALVGAFTSHLRDRGFSFELVRLHEMSYAQTGSQFGLTPKQHEALVTAWQMGFFELPRETSMAVIAKELDITPQSLSDRLRRAQNTLIGDALRVAVRTSQVGPGND